MNYDEFKQIAKGMKSIWPKSDFIPDRFAFDMWYGLLKDLSYENCLVAVQRYALLSKWPPTIAEIREQAVIIQSNVTDWSEGWAEVQTAIRRFGRYGTTDALNSLSPVTAEAVVRIGWVNICMAQEKEQAAVRANFRNVYNQIVQAEKEQATLPDALKDAIKQIGQGGNNESLHIGTDIEGDRATASRLLSGAEGNRGAKP